MYDIVQLPPTPKQLDYARAIARRLDTAIPRAGLEDRRALSHWIDAHKPGAARGPRRSRGSSAGRSPMSASAMPG